MRQRTLARLEQAATAVLCSDWKILVGELIFTLALAYVVLNVMSAEATEGNSFYGPAIGFTVATGIFSVDRTTGRVFNLAVALGSGVTGALAWSHSWIYVLAGLVGGAGAAALFTYLHPSRREGERPLLSQVDEPVPGTGPAGAMPRNLP